MEIKSLLLGMVLFYFDEFLLFFSNKQQHDEICISPTFFSNFIFAQQYPEDYFQSPLDIPLDLWFFW